ncbi:glycosyl hydrolase [Spongiimicrobium sp. 3-5]|uniref:glycosyl hydrolase n=1 Tax=Spongiimicrobium sp. 3-5 TaxID=3332596 RepID=UPI0039818698
MIESEHINPMRKNTIILVGLICLFIIGIPQNCQAQDKGNYELLKAEFKNPPMEAWPKTYWWWLNGNIDTVRIREEIISMKNAGLSGFDIFEIGKKKSDTVIPTGEITFMGADFLRAVEVALDQAAELNMEVGLNMASSWNAGGAWITPEYAAKSIYFSKTPFKRGKQKLPFPKQVRFKKEGKIVLEGENENVDIERTANGKPVFYAEIAVIAIPTGQSNKSISKGIDVTQYFDSKTETLNWDQEGTYDIYRYICSNSGEQLKIPSKNSAGPIIDHFDGNATEFHFNYIIDRLKKTIGPDLEKSALKSLYLASYEALGNVWTELLPQEFERLNGYEIYPYIPALFEKNLFSTDVTAKIKKDFQFTLSELMINNFYKKARQICHENGLLINSESGGPGFPLHNVPVEPLKSLGVMDLPRGEFWINHNRFNSDGVDILRMVKESASASHIYGRGIVEEEAFTSFQMWQEGPFEMKPSGDRAFCEGMNKVVVHGSSHNPRGFGNPGIVYHAGTHYNDKRIWWPMIKPFNTYLARISNILQKADFFADVLYYYGDAAPNFTGHKNGRFMVGPGYDYEVINTEILKQITLQNDQLVLPTGAKFSLLILENEEEIDPEVLLKLKALTSKGAKIISEKPNGVTVREKLSKVKVSLKDVDKLWFNVKESTKNPTAIKGKVLSGITPTEMLENMNVPPDFQYPDAEFSTLDYIHYQKGTTDYYLVRNTTDRWVSRQSKFRQTGKTPELWDPVTGETQPVSIYEQQKQYISLPLTLPPYGSVFVVFSEKKIPAAYRSIESGLLNPPLVQYTAYGTFFLENQKVSLQNGTEERTISNFVKTEPINGAWEVYFPEGQEAPRRVIFPKLVSWTKAQNEGIKYFSGIAKYVKTFQYDIHSNSTKNQRIYLDLGNLSNVGEVWLNGKNLGIVWAKPYRLDVTDVIKPGNNLLEIKIANTWSNRLTGDAITGKRFTHTNVKTTNIEGLNKTQVPWKEVPLLDSGLFGPVRLMIIKPIE